MGNSGRRWELMFYLIRAIYEDGHGDDPGVKCLRDSSIATEDGTRRAFVKRRRRGTRANVKK
jgi:hypothetical protein